MQGSRWGDSHESGDVIPPAEESFPLKRVFLSPIMERGARSEGGDGGPEGAGYKEAPFQAPVRSEVGPLITGDLINR